MAKNTEMRYMKDCPAYNHLGYTQDGPVNGKKHWNALYEGPSCV